MIKSDYIIIMGAAVKQDGQPSGALARRVNSAIKIAAKFSNSIFIVTGGIGKSAFSEAFVMKKLLLDAGIKTDKIILDEKSNDTLSSVLCCIKILKLNQNYNQVYICSDRYHIPRCRWLFFLSGIPTNFAEVDSGYKANGILRWIFYYVREAVAFPYDTILLLLAIKILV